MMHSLTCFRATCHGTLEYTPENRTGALYECAECGSGISQEFIEELAEEDSILAELAQELLDGIGEEQ